MKKKYVVLSLVGVAILIAIPSVLYLMGFRITYAPALENSWDAVSACAAWAGAIATTAAVFIAIWIPKKIADRQDKIALFDRKLECYMKLQALYAFSSAIRKNNSVVFIKEQYKLWLSLQGFTPGQLNLRCVATDLMKTETVFMLGNFLFLNYNIEILQEIVGNIKKLMFGLKSDQLTETQIKLRDDLCNSIDDFYITYNDKMEAEINLNG